MKPDIVVVGKKDKPLVSVIIPTYNRARRLQDALASVCVQEGVGDQFEMEVIVVDDASSDETPEVMRAHLSVRYIRLPMNCGASAARNAGIKASKGKYVAFLDDDDVWLPYRLSLQVPVLEINPDVGVVYSQFIHKLGDQVAIWPEPNQAPSGLVFRSLLMRNFTSSLSVLIRRAAFEKTGHFDETLPTVEDYEMMLRLAFHVPFKFVPGPVAIARRSIQSKSSTHALEGRHEKFFRAAIEKALSLLPVTDKDYLQVSREARARVGLIIADKFDAMGEPQQMRRVILKTLEEFPWMAGEPWARSWVAWKIRGYALTSESPLAVVRAFCSDAMTAAGNDGLKGLLRTRGLLADVWKQVAMGLANEPSPQYREAGHAAVYAILNSPKKFGRSLLWVMAQTVFNSPANSMAASKTNTPP